MTTVDKVVLLLTLVICFNVSLGVWDSTMNDDYNPDRQKVISDVLTQMLAVVILYVGNKMRNS